MDVTHSGVREARYDILFEPVRIGPVTARNRFYQVPHCNGMGYRDPTALAVMRGVKAEGGWAVVCTEQVELHHTSEITPFIELRLWDDRDIPALARMAEQIHRHGSLAGFDLIYVYAAHGLGFLHHFLSRRFNDRTDEYGGSIENRIRLLCEITEEAKNAVGDTCAVPIRISVDELRGTAGLHRAEVEEMIGLMAELPDLWDVTLAGWENDSLHSESDHG